MFNIFSKPLIAFMSFFFLLSFSILPFSCQTFAQSNVPSYDIVILGSGPAGLSASIYTARNQAKTLVIEGPAPGGSIVRAKKVENYPGFPGGVSGEELMGRMYEQAMSFNVEFSSTLATKVTPEKNGHLVSLSDGTSVLARAIIVATGTSEHLLGLEGEQELIDNGIFICAECDAPFFKGKTVMIAGGGQHALEEAGHIIDFVEKLYIVHEGAEFDADKKLIDSINSHPKITVLLNSKIVTLNAGVSTGPELFIASKNNKSMNLPPEKLLNSVDVLDLKETDKSQNLKTYKLDGLLVATGQISANTSFLPKQVQKSKDGYILVRNGVETSIPGIFAAGNVFDREYRQVVVATGLGAQAAMRAHKYIKAKSDNI